MHLFGLLYSKNGLCLYDEKTASVVESHDVIFNKFTKGIEMKQEEKKFIQVEIFNEGGNSEHEEDTDQEVVNEAGGSEWTEII